MKRLMLVLLVLISATALLAEDLTVGMILSAHRAGADANGLIKMINDPVYTSIKISPADLETLKTAGVPQEAIAALKARMPEPAPAPAAAVPDDKRLTDVVRMSKSGISESLIVGQIEASGLAYNLSAADLIYLKENGVSETVIGALMATKSKAMAPAPAAAAAAPAAPAPAVLPGETVVDNLVLAKRAPLKKDRTGRIALRAEGIDWLDANKADENFSIKSGGVERVWLTSQAKGTTIFPFQVNIQIAKGPRYRFQDVNRPSGSNEAVLKLFEAIKARFPNILIGEPDIEK